MRYLNSVPKLNTVILILFAIAWLYTEIEEYNARADYKQEVDRFMNRGNRFTADEGRDMRARLEELEAEHDISVQ